MSIAEKFAKIAENEKKIYDVGKERGKAEEDGDRCAFWDKFQDCGERTDYTEAFKCWKDADFKPLYYRIKPQKMDFMFSESSITNIVDRIELDTSNADTMNNAFSISDIEKIGYIDCTGLSNSETKCFNEVFKSCEKLTDIETIKMYQNITFDNAFNGAGAITTIRFEPCNDETSVGIGQEGLSFGDCSKLSWGSVASIINALSKSTNKLTITFNKAVENYPLFETSKATRQNWIFKTVEGDGL